MSEYPTAEEELKMMDKRFWEQVEVTERVVKERDEARKLAEKYRDNYCEEEGVEIFLPWEE